jgi:phosphoglycerol transferase MdoB-like AlkP superfamily enzyme
LRPTIFHLLLFVPLRSALYQYPNKSIIIKLTKGDFRKEIMSKICKESFLNSFFAAIYITLVAVFMSFAEGLFKSSGETLTSILVLLLFSLSALVVGGLLLGKPLMTYLDGKKKDAVLMVFANAGWLVLFFIVVAIITIIVK